MKAWTVTFGGEGMTVHAPTRSKAVYKCWLWSGLSDSYSFSVALRYLRARRTPDLDTEEEG